MLNTPFAPWPSFDKEEIAAVAQVLRSNRVNYWTGDECRSFEKEFAAWAGTSRAVAVANGTVALDLALMGLGIGSAYGGSETDEVIVTPRTFLASVSCVINAGARPVFADVDADSGNITAKTITPLLTCNTKGVIVVHLAGWPADMDAILTVTKPRGIRVIEDCAQAHGARWNGRSVGSIGDAGAWSFCQDKIMTTGGEGGMVTTNDPELWSRMWSFKDHGKSWEAVYEKQHPPGFRWLHDSIGTNWRMLEMQAAIGRIQLRRMTEWTAARTKNANMLRAALADLSGSNGVIRIPALDVQAIEQSSLHAHYKFYAYVRTERLAADWNRDRIVAEINAAGVPCFQGSCSEVYLERAFDRGGYRPDERLPHARLLGETSLMFLVHPTLTPAEMALTGNVAKEILTRAKG